MSETIVENISENKPRKQGFRERVYHIIDNEEVQTDGSQFVEMIITILILLSIVAIILESFAELKVAYGFYFNFFESATLAIFTVEYALRLWTADYKYKDTGSWFSAARKFVTSGSGLIDLIAISPLALHAFGFMGYTRYTEADFRFIRILKVTRVLRIFKMNAFTNSIAVVASVFTEKKSDLGITVFVAFVLMLVSSTIMWYVEGDAQPDKFPNIIASFWWAVATLTTVGYGDVYPITGWGKFLAGSIALIGIGLVALPAGILSSAFIEKLQIITGNTDKSLTQDEITELSTDLNSKTVLPQAQFQGGASYKKGSEEAVIDNAENGKEQKIIQESLQHEDCKNHFGQAFVYCPYCGQKLEGDTHKH